MQASDEQQAIVFPSNLIRCEFFTETSSIREWIRGGLGPFQRNSRLPILRYAQQVVPRRMTMAAFFDVP
jgi:hypothetical protein